MRFVSDYDFVERRDYGSYIGPSALVFVVIRSFIRVICLLQTQACDTMHDRRNFESYSFRLVNG